VVGDDRSEHSRDVQFCSVSEIIDWLICQWLALMSPLRSFAVPQLQKTKGRIIIMCSQASQLRMPFSSEYCTSKHALVRFAELITIGKSL
jgi:short-subunit dehydrogenase